MSDPDGKEYTDAAVGVGAVDAVFKAIERIVGTKFVLDNFTVQVCALPCLALPCLALPCLALRCDVANGTGELSIYCAGFGFGLGLCLVGYGLGARLN
jgi:hypothetical protein